jgi:geranylgeranyl reductase family protein
MKSHAGKQAPAGSDTLAAMAKVDVLVVGAGPAGCCAAAAAARAGAEVLLIDRERFPRPKTCGDGVLETCLEPLFELGIADSVLLAPGRPLGGVRLQLVDGTERLGDFGTRSGRPFIHVARREVLDARLLAAVRAIPHVHVEEGVAVRSLVQDDEGTVVGVRGDAIGSTMHEAAVTIDAGGAHSPLARASRCHAPQGHSAVVSSRAYFEGVAGLDERIEFLFHAEVPAAYFWIFPCHDGRANVGIALYRGGISLRRAREIFLGSPSLAPRFQDACRVSAWQGAEIPVQRTLDSRVRAGLILCGDAARLCDPLTFHGIGPAMRSGRHAGHVAARAAARLDIGTESLREYDRLWQGDFGLRQQMVASLLFGFEPQATKVAPDAVVFRSLFEAIVN